MRVKYMSMYTIKLKIEHTHIVEHHRAALKKNHDRRRGTKRNEMKEKN